MSSRPIPITWNESKQMYELVKDGSLPRVFDDFGYVRLLADNIGIFRTIRMLYGNTYRNSTSLASSDVARIYDKTYAEMLDLQPVVKYVNGVPLNYYLLFAFDYLATIPDREKKCVLDLGCGTGDLCLALGSIGYTVHGIDTSDFVLELARGKASRAELDKAVRFEKADCCSLRNQTFDFIVLSDVVEHLSETEIRNMLAEYSHLLAADGELVIHTPNGRTHPWCKERWKVIDVFYLFRDIRRRFMSRQMQENLLASAYYEQTHINIMSPEMITRLLKSCEFNSVKVFFRDDTPFGLHKFGFSGSMGVVARRK